MSDWLPVALRALGFVAVLQAAGAGLFLAMFGHDIDVARFGILRLTRVAVAAAAVLLSVQYVLEPARMAGAFSGVFDAQLQSLALHSRLVLVFAMRVAGLLLLAWALRRHGAGMRSYGVAGAVLIALSFPVMGHSAENPARWWLMPLLGLHLLVVAFWFGALLPLILVGERESTRVAGRVVENFSRLAVWLVPLIFVAGVIIAVKLLPNLAALESPYGIGLMLKVLAFTLLMGFAALNKWRLGPALANGSQAAHRRLRVNIGIEFVLIALVLTGTAILTAFWSPES